MGRKGSRDNKKVEAVLQLLQRSGPLTIKQEKFCNAACVERFMKAKGESVKKAAKQLRACLTWRESIGTDYLIADEFSAEIAEGIAYVAGQDEEARPVMVFRIKQDYQKYHSQKMYIRLLVFTLEVAIASLSKNVEQFVLLFDAGFFRSATACLNLLLATFKTLSEYYPGRLAKAFIIDPPSLFSCLWKGVRPFVELSTVTTVVSSLDFDDSFTSFPTRATSLRFDHPIPRTPSSLSCSSSRFSFTVSQLDTLKPWYLTHSDAVPSATPTSSHLGPALVSPLNARSYSFASPAARTPTTPNWNSRRASLGSTAGTRSFPSTPSSQHQQNQKENRFPSFLPSPGFFSKKGNSNVDQQQQQMGRCERNRESFRPFLGLYRAPYSELGYRSKMKPPLGGLLSIVSPHIKRRSVMPNRF